MLTIRRKQMDGFRAYMRQSFEDGMVEHIAHAHPAEYDALVDAEHGDARVRDLVREGIGRAATYEIATEHCVAQFIGLMVTVAPNFEETYAMGWAKEVLEDGELPEEAKMDVIYAELDAQKQASQDRDA